MLLLLEHDRVKQKAAMAAAKRAGLSLTAIDEEDALRRVDMPSVELLLLGRDWPGDLLTKLREQGLHAPAIYVSTSLADEAVDMAKTLGCVDVVTYPLEMEYLRRWIPPATKVEPNTSPAESHSPLEAILARRRAPDGRPRDLNPLHDTAQDDPDAPLRGRVIVVHSARGGVGKSTVTALMARILAKQGVSVGVIDLDPKGNLQAIHHRQAALTTDDFTRLPAQMDDVTLRESLVSIDGWHLLPSGRMRDGLDPLMLRRLVQPFARAFDVVLIDTSPSSAITYAALDLADRVVFVMTPEWMAFKRFVEEYELVRHVKSPERVVVAVNRIRRHVTEHRRALRLLDEAGVRSVVVHMPEDRRLYRALMSAGPLAGSRPVQDATQHVIEALRLVPERLPVRRSRGWRKAVATR